MNEDTVKPGVWRTSGELKDVTDPLWVAQSEENGDALV